jgi:hypothetical protein
MGRVTLDLEDKEPGKGRPVTTSADQQEQGQPQPPSIPYELRIGVTGHREFDDPAAVRRAIRALLERLIDLLAQDGRGEKSAAGTNRWERLIQLFDAALTRCLALSTGFICPVANWLFRLAGLPQRWNWPVVPAVAAPTPVSQTPLKLTVVSCLAEGADQLMVDELYRILTESPPPGVIPANSRNRYLEAVLPFSPDEYERDFVTSDGVAKFRWMLELDRGRLFPRSEPVIVPLASPASSDADGNRRSQAFAAAGRMVVDACEILLAVWDPERDENTGGTGETARYAIGCGRVVIWLNPRQLQDGWRVLQRVPIETRRPGKSQLATAQAPAGLIAQPLPETARELSPSFHQLAAYNRDRSASPDDLASSLTEDSAEFRANAVGKLPERVIAIISDRILPHVVKADLLSRRYRELRDTAARLWPLLAATAVTLMAFQILFLPEHHWLGWIELLLLLTCAAFYRVSLHEAWHDKWLNDRRLAEALRTVLYTSLADDSDAQRRSDSPSTGSDPAAPQANSLPFYDPRQTWFIGAVKRIIRHERRAMAADINWSRDLHGIAGFLSEEWLRGQARFHRAAAARHHRQARRFARWRLLLVGLIILISVVHALGIGHQHHASAGNLLARIDLWIALATVALPAWAAALHALSTSEDDERLTSRSQHMAPLLDALADRMQRVDTQLELAACVREAEALLDLESHEWAESLSERKPEFSG